jgi:hypothetical protein
MRSDDGWTLREDPQPQIMFGSSLVGSLLALGLAFVPAPELWKTENRLYLFNGVLLLFLINWMSASRSPTKSWPPVLRVTTGRIRAARAVLAVALLNLIVWGVSAALAASRHRPAPEWLIPPVMSSIFLLPQCWALLYWAFRPENVLSRGGWRCLHDPIRGTAFVLRHRQGLSRLKRARRNAATRASRGATAPAPRR